MVRSGGIDGGRVLNVRSAAEQIIEHFTLVAFAFGELKTVLLAFVRVVINLQKNAIKLAILELS
jgi:hypothetical protein